jgi:ATP-binding cassette subfamily B protein
LIGRELIPNWPGLSWVIFLQLFYVPLALVAPLPLKLLADCVIAGKPWPHDLAFLIPFPAASMQGRVIVVAFLTLLVAIVVQLHSLLSWTADARFGSYLTLRFRNKLFAHLQALPFAYHDSTAPGDSVYRVNNDSESIRNIVLQLIPFIVSFFTIVGFFLVLFRIDRFLTFVAFVPAPIAISLLVTQRHRSRRIWDAVYSSQSAIFGSLQEVVSSIRLVRSFGQEQQELKRYGEMGQLNATRAVSAIRFDAFVGGSIAVAFALGSALIILLGAGQVQRNALSFGDLLIFISYSGALYGPLLKLSRASSDLQQHLASATRAFAILEEKVEIPYDQAGIPLPKAGGSFRFEGVSYSHAQRDESTVLSGVNFAVPSGATVGIFGQSGAGKTTLLNLICRFFDPAEGRIYLDDVDIRQYSVADLRRQYAVVHQETLLMSNSILENLTYSKPTASREEVEEAAIAAGIHDFILSLPDGFNTPVGDKGMKLSGGERQRLAIARAFLRNSPILILDEPTSSLDAETENQILQSLLNLMKTRTTFIVSHRPGMFQQCDLLLEVTGNRVLARNRGPK